MELRRKVILQELHKLGFYDARDGRLLQKLTLQELELELFRLPELESLK